MRLPALCLALVLTCLAGHAEDFVHTARTTFLNEQAKSRRVGIEIELRGLGPEQVLRILLERLGGSITKSSGSETLIEGTRIGEIRVYLDGNRWRKAEWFGIAEDEPHWSDPLIKVMDRLLAPIEIVTAPLEYGEVGAVHDVAQALKAAGAKGTNPWRAVSTQVNVEIFRPGSDPKSVENVRLLTAFLQTYYDEQNAKQTLESLKPPRLRREYILPVHESFARKLRDASYKPSADELYFDYLYLQTYARRVGDPSGKSPDEIRAGVLAMGDVVDKDTVKMSRVKATSALLVQFPDEPLSRAIQDSRWAKKIPVVEFREHNTDFDVQGAVDWALGTVQAVSEHGYFSHDQLMSELSGLDPIVLEELRQNGKRRSLRIIRYEMAAEPYSELPTTLTGKLRDVWERAVYYGKAEFYELPETAGAVPVHVKGNSVMWHRRHIHRNTLVARHNPGLVNYNLQMALENKIFEALLWRRYVPRAMPDSRVLSEVLSPKKVSLSGLVTELRVRWIKAKLDRAFPQGWVLKGAYDLNTGQKMLITHKDNLVEMLRRSGPDFDAFSEELERAHPDYDSEHLMDLAKEHPGYKGSMLRRMLEDPEMVLVQEWMDIEAEYRVSAVEGRVLSRDAVFNRYFYEQPFAKRLLTSLKKTFRHDARADQILKAVNGWLEKLPEHFRRLPYGFDVAIVRDRDGKFGVKLVETNAGGNDAFLYEWHASSMALNDYLADYARRAAKGQAYLGLDPREQMLVLGREIQQLGLDPVRNFKGMIFTETEVVDPDSMPKHPACQGLLDPAQAS